MKPTPWLKPLAVAYGGVIRARNLYYDHARGAVRHAGIPTISVGNITVGGTGKTPLVIEIARRLLDMHRRPAILTRGYKGRPGALADEVQEYHASVPAVPVVVDPDRVRGAATARSDHHADCLVLDDGFQHRRLGRNLDIVLIDALRPWGGAWEAPADRRSNGALLPAGGLREPLDSLRRADLFVITRTNQVEPERVEAITARLERYAPGRPVMRAQVRPDRAVLRDGRSLPVEALAGRRLLPVSAIGNALTFERMVHALSPLSASVAFPDHHRYSSADVDLIRAQALRHGAEWVVTTRKDWAKLEPLWPADQELVRLEMRLELGEQAELFWARVREALEPAAAGSGPAPNADARPAGGDS